MSVWKTFKLKSGDVAVDAPWHSLLKDEMKRILATWKSVNTKSGPKMFWVFKERHRDRVEALCKELYDGELVEKMISFSSEHHLYHAPTVDGYDVVGFNRDNYWVRKFPKGAPFEVIEVIDEDIINAGSHRNPHMWGTIKLRVRCRPQAALDEAWNGKVVTDE